MTSPTLAGPAWLHVVFDDDPTRIFLYRKAEIYRAVITRDDVELLVDLGSIVIVSPQLDTIVPEILDETKTSYLKAGVHGIKEILYYAADEKPDKGKEMEL
jgi:hypothetical protein